MYQTIILPFKRGLNNTGLAKILKKRRSIREYASKPLYLEELSMILWAAQGVTNKKEKLRTSPSAGAIYPIEIYVHTTQNGLLIGEEGYADAGVYHYDPHRHTITMTKQGDFKKEMYHSSYNQECILNAPLHIIIGAESSKTIKKYGIEAGKRFVYLEAGHVSQNIYLMATAQKLGTVAVGSFDREETRKILGLRKEIELIYIMPLGRTSR